MSKVLARNGVIVIVGLISPYRETRAYARSELPRFVEVFIKCDLQICIRRDVKGLYARALNGEIQQMTGISDPYEEPTEPEVTVETDNSSVESGRDKILKKIHDLGYLN